MKNNYDVIYETIKNINDKCEKLKEERIINEYVISHIFKKIIEMIEEDQYDTDIKINEDYFSLINGVVNKIKEEFISYEKISNSKEEENEQNK